MAYTVRGWIPSQWLWTGCREREHRSAETMILAAPEKEVLKMQPLSKVKGLYKSMFGAEEYGSQYL